MKFIKTYEQMKDFYPGSKIGTTDDYLYLIVTKDEKWAIWGHTIDDLNLSIRDRRFKLNNLNKIESDDSYKLTDLSDYSWKSKEHAQEFIDLIESGPDGYKGIDDNGTVEIDLKVRRAEFDKNLLPYKGYIAFKSPGWAVNLKKEYSDVKQDRGDWYVDGTKFKQDNHNRYIPYDRDSHFEPIYTDLKDNLKIVTYAVGAIRRDNEDLN